MKRRGQCSTSAQRITALEWSGLAAVLCLAFALRAVLVAQSAAQDDAYITYRYAANLAGAAGFVYNPGERVLGTTTPLFTLVLGLAARLGVSPESAAPWFGVVSDVLIGALGWFTLRSRVERRLAWLWLVFYSTFYIPLQACAHGMESQLFVALVLAAMLGFEQRRFAATGVLVGLGFLVRVEAVLLLPLFLFEQWVRERRLRPRPMLVLGVGAFMVVLPWLVFALYYFGTVIPNSIAAKHFGANATLRDWMDTFIGRNPLSVGLWFLFGLGAFSLLRSRGATVRLWLGWTVAYLLFMLVVRPPFYAPWYMPAMMPGLLLGGAAGAAGLAGMVRLRGRRSTIAILLAWLAIAGFAWPRNLAKVRAFRSVMHAVYMPMGRWIAANSTPDESVFAGDIGYVGWISGRRILDEAGLVSPQVWHFYRDHAADSASHVSFVLAERPRFVVASTKSPYFTSWTTPEFNRVYEPVVRFHRSDADEARLGPDSDYTIFSLRETERP